MQDVEHHLRASARLHIPRERLHLGRAGALLEDAPAVVDVAPVLREALGEADARAANVRAAASVLVERTLGERLASAGLQDAVDHLDLDARELPRHHHGGLHLGDFTRRVDGDLVLLRTSGDGRTREWVVYGLDHVVHAISLSLLKRASM